jgi:predicted Zn-dependent peptidase
LTDLDKVKETLIRERETMMKENAYWLNVLQNMYRQKDKLMTLEEYRKIIRSVNRKDIRNVARKYINENNYVIGKLLPKQPE